MWLCFSCTLEAENEDKGDDAEVVNIEGAWKCDLFSKIQSKREDIKEKEWECDGKMRGEISFPLFLFLG